LALGAEKILSFEVVTAALVRRLRSIQGAQIVWRCRNWGR